jgi:pimeloyl-ACP methyl ester carboxylesterase
LYEKGKMKIAVILLIITLGFCKSSFTQTYEPVIEPCACTVKSDPSLIVRCGNLLVPENRERPRDRIIKIPFIYVKNPESDSTKNIVLFTTGGPGYSTTAGYDSISKRLGFLQFGGFIAFDQRGTKKAQPCLDCPGIDAAIQRAYKETLPKDSLVLLAVKKCRKDLVKQGIDLSAYNTIESAADINDLRRALKIDSLTLYGVSYSGGLMLTVARNHPEGVKALILNSPLPGYVNYEEHALLNHNEALSQVFDNCETDSANNKLYDNLRTCFQQYFTSITGKSFMISYVEKATQDTLTIKYTKQELLDAVIDRMNTAQVKTVPFVITELINGNHAMYIKEVLDGIFGGNKSLSAGMRYSVYCSEQIAYADKNLVLKQASVLPWFADYISNNVDHAICDCWKVKPENRIAKTPVYSTIPALILAGDADPWCRPFYNRLIKRYMPNSQLLIMRNRGHTPGLYIDGIDFGKLFMDNPYKKIISATKNVWVE